MRTIAILILLCAPALAQEGPKLTSEQRDQCRANLPVCSAYARGVKDEMDGEIQWSDETHQKVVTGNWDSGVTVDQIIRVFMEYAQKNPAELNKPVRDVIRRSAEAAGIYLYSTVP